jgi:hypothetical protein
MAERFRRGPRILYVFSSRAYHIWTFNMRDAAMGTTADRIARNIAVQARAPVVDLAAHRSARQLFKEAEIDRDGFQRRIANGLDPCFAVYAHAQAMVSIAAEHLSTTKEAQQFARIVGEAEDTYMPSYPPMSPVTTSHFAMWSLFDVQFGQSRETIGTCFLRIAELAEWPVELRTAVATLQASRLGIYVHLGNEGSFVRLREIGTEATVLCLVPAGYRGDVGEIWLARLLPPASARFAYHVVATTPYIVRGGAEAQWLAYLERERQRVGSKIPVRKMGATRYIMKHGPTANHWNEYILSAYAGHRKEAVFLTGIPDIKESLPHA